MAVSDEAAQPLGLRFAEDSTPSCGDSRFGCWVCTLAEHQILVSETDHHLRDFRRMNGAVQLMKSGREIFSGPTPTSKGKLAAQAAYGTNPDTHKRPSRRPGHPADFPGGDAGNPPHLDGR